MNVVLGPVSVKYPLDTPLWGFIGLTYLNIVINTIFRDIHTISRKDIMYTTYICSKAFFPNKAFARLSSKEEWVIAVVSVATELFYLRKKLHAPHRTVPLTRRLDSNAAHLTMYPTHIMLS